MNWALLKNSLLVSAFTTLSAVAMGFVSALCLSGIKARWRNRLLALTVLPLALPPFLVTNCWLDLLGPTGVWRTWLPINIVSLGGTIWILSLLTWPFSMLAIWSAWQRLESSQLECDPAVTGWGLIRALLWPSARGALTQGGVLTFVLALNNFAVPAILQVKVFPAEVWVRFSTNFDTLGALRLSWPLVVVPLVLLLWWIRQEIRWPRTEGAHSPRLLRQQLGRGWFWSCGAIMIVLCLLAVGLPLLRLISVKRSWVELPGAFAAGQLALWNSFWFAALSATVVIVLGLSAGAWRLRGHNRTHAATVSGAVGWLLWLPLLVPGVLLGIGLITLFNRPALSFLYQSAGIVILAFSIRYLALGWNTVAHAWQAIDRDLTDVALLEGASRWQMLRYVWWPQIAPQVGAVWYIVFLLCLWDVESMILVVPPGGETLALRVFNLLHYGHNAQVNALCLTLLVLGVGPLVLWRLCRGLQVAWQFKTARKISGVRPRTALVSLVLAGYATLLLAGCGSGSSSSQSSLASKTFSSVQVIGTRGVGIGQLNKPRSVAVDNLDNLYVVDMTGRVQKFTPDGAFLLSWQMPQTDLGKPKGMGRDCAGNIVVVEPHYQRVNHFTPEGKLVGQWGDRGTNAGQFIMPRAVAVSSQGEVYVSEYGVVERIQRFSLAKGETGMDRSQSPETGTGIPVPGVRIDLSAPPRLLNSFGEPGNLPGQFNRPEGLCLDLKGNLYVADSCNHRIEIFSKDGGFIRTYGKPGQGLGELSYPYDVCVDREGRQYVCEFGNSRIQIFDAQDQPLEIIGGSGAEPGRFSNPWGVALDSAGNLYVADSQNHRVQKFIRRKSIATEPQPSDRNVGWELATLDSQ